MTKVAGSFQLPSAKTNAQQHDAKNETQADDTRRVPATICGIELPQERRTALISAAVTGKIDVRNFERTTIKT